MKYNIIENRLFFCLKVPYFLMLVLKKVDENSIDMDDFVWKQVI